MVQENRRGLKKFGLRKCLTCKHTFPLDNEHFFKNNSKGSSGLDWYCKECHKVNGRKYYKIAVLKERFDLLKKFNFTCQYCGRKAPEVILEVDHIIPLSKEGSSEKSNLTLACRECNIGKGNKSIKHHG